MANKKILQKAVSNLDKAKAPAKKADIDYVSKMGYRDDSPFNKRKSITINTQDGSIDMSNTGQPLIANGKYLPPYSGIHQFDTNEVIETKLDQAKKGGSKKYSKSLLATNRLFKKNPLFKKPKYKGKTYDPNAMYFEEGGSVEMELTPAQIQKYVDGGYVVEDISVPELTQAQGGGNTDAMIKADPELQFIPRNKLQEFTEGFPGANALMYQNGGNLPKAQEGYINFTPYSNRGDMPGVETFGSKNPTMNIGYTRDITGRLVKDQGFEKAIGNVTAKLPYNNNTGVGIQGGLKLVGDRIKAIQDVTKANVETDFIAGYDPKLGFHSSLIASPQFTFGNVQPTMSKVYGTGLKSGEWLVKAGPYAGVSAIPGRDLKEERFSIPAGVKANVDFGLGRRGIKAGLSGYFGVDAFGQAGSNATNATDAGQTQGRTHYGLEAGLKIPLNLPVNWAKKLIAEKEKEDDYYTPRLQQGGVNNNYIDIDADDDDIANYIAQGYQVKELPKAQYAGQTPFVHPDAGATNVLFQKPTTTKPNSKYNKNTPVNYQAKLKPVVADNTRDVTADNAVLAKQINDYMGTDEYKANQKAEKEAQVQFEKEQWDKYNKMSFGEKVSDRTNAALNQWPVMLSNTIAGEQAYIPGMASGLGDGGPDYDRWLKATGQTRGFSINDAVNVFNPGNWGGHAGRQYGEGNYLTGALELGLGLLGLKGAPLMGNQLAKSSANKLINLEQKAGQALSTPKNLINNLSKSKNIKQAVGSFAGVPPEGALPRMAADELKTFRKIQEIGRMQSKFAPISEQYEYALKQGIPDEHLQQVFGKSREEIESAISILQEQEAIRRATPISARETIDLSRQPTEGVVTNDFGRITAESTPEEIAGFADLMNMPVDQLRGLMERSAATNRSNIIRHALMAPPEGQFRVYSDFSRRNNAVNLYGQNKSFSLPKIKEDRLINFSSAYPMYKGRVIQNVPSLSLRGSGSLKNVSDKVASESTANINSGDVFTGSLNTSHSSYLPQLKQTFKYTEGAPQFVGYQPMNSLGFLSDFHYSNDDIAKYLNTEIDEQIKRGIVPKDVLRPYIQHNKPNRILLPHYGIKQFEDGGSLELDLSPEEIQAYKDGGYIVEELSKYQLAGAVQNDAGYKAATEELQAIIKQRDNDLTYARTPALKAQVNKQYDQAIKDATFRQQNAYKAASTAGTKQVKNIIATSNEAAVINAEKAKIKKQEEARRQKEAADRALNPEFYNSETLPAVARRSGALLTDYEVEQDRLLKESLAEQRAFVAKDYINNNREALINEITNEAKSRFKNLDWDKAKELAMFSIDNADNLKSQFPNATPAEIEQYKIFIGDAREKIKSKAYAYTSKVDLHDALKTAGYYREPWSPERDQIKAVDPNDPTHVEMSGRMPQTLGEWGTRIADIVANPLDAIHYGMSSDEMPMNMYDYEKAKSQLGYEDGADKNLIMQGLDMASWLTGSGAVAQGVKMLRPTGETIYDFAQDPTWANAGNAALNIGFNALAFLPLGKIPGANTKSLISNPTSRYAAYGKFPGNRQIVYGNPALQEAESVFNLPGFKLAKGKIPTSNVPSTPVSPFEYTSGMGTGMTGYADRSKQGLLTAISEPYAVTQSPLTVQTNVPSFTQSPLTSITPTVDEASGYKYGSLYSKPVDNVTGATPLLDTEISLYRQQPKGFTNEYTGPDDPRLIEHVGWGEVGDPNYQAPIVFPYDTVGNWWDSNANRMATTGVSPNTQFSLSNNPQQEVEILKVNLPFSEASKYAASKNPEGAPWALQDTEYILPEKYKAEAESTPFVQGQSPVTVSANIAEQPEAVEKLSGTDDQVVSSVFNDIRDRKVDLWQTPEGQQRLQKMIDNTPSLEGQTPQTLVERMVSLKNTNTVRAERQNRIDNINKEIEELDDLEAEGVISQNDVVLRNMKLDEELKVLNQAVADEQEYLSLSTNRIAASYDSKINTVDVNPDVFSETDLRKVTSHELGHVLGVNDASLDPTYLDDMLGGLDLVKNTSRQLSIPGLENGEPSSGAHGLFGEAKENYIDESIRYFKEGSGGTEKVPMLSEVREDLLEKGIIKTEYDPITPKMLKDHFKDYKSVRGEKYPLRIYDIIKDKPDNFSLLAKTLNYLPYVAIGVSAINDATNDDENVSEAGFSGYAGMVAALAVFSKKPKFKLPKKAIAAGTKFLRAGYEALSFKDKGLLREWYKLDELIDEKSKAGWDINHPLNIAMQQTESNARNKANKIGYYQKRKRLAKQSYKTNEDIAVDKRMTQTAERYQDVEGIEKTSEGLGQNIPSMFEGITKTGQKQITDFSTGNQVAAEVLLPSTRQEFKKVNGQLVVEDKSTVDVRISPEYSQALKNSINQVQTDIPGAKVFGSSVLVSEAGMPHLTDDIDLLITQSAYDKNVKNKYNYVGTYGPAEQHNVYPQYGEEGILDFNIIHEDANGNVKAFYNSALPDKTPTELELFRQFYPEQFQEAAKKSLISGNPIEINMKASDFLAGIDPKVKTIVDSYETSPMSKWGNYNANKEKHINRPDVLITYGEPSVVAQGQEAYIKSVVGPKGSLGHQFTKEELSDVNQNIFTLRAMDYKGDIYTIASNPDRMQLVLNDYYINNSVFSREIAIPQGQKATEDFIKKVLTEWTPGYGASLHGIGLNAVQKGNPAHMMSHQNPILGHRQLGFELNTKDPQSYVDSIIRATSGNYAFTPEELIQVQDIFKKYLPDQTNRILNIKTSRDILDIGSYSSINMDSANEALKEFSSTTGIRAIRKDKDIGGGYGGSIYATLLGGFDEAIDAMMYSLKDVHVSPKSMNMRDQGLTDKKSQIADNMPKAVVNTLKDFDKISNLLDTGIATADLRLSNLIQQKEAIEAQEKAFRDKLMTVENEAVKEAMAAKEKVNKEVEDLINQRDDLNKKRQKVRDNREKIVLGLVMGSGVAGAAGIIYAINTQDNSSRREFNKTIKLQEKKALPILIKERGIDKRWIDVLPESARRYLYAKPNELTWPTGEPIEITDDGYLFNPKTLEYTGGGNYEWKYDQKYKKPASTRKKAQSEEPGFIDGFKSSGTPKFEYGGIIKNTIEAELTREEIKDYLSRGYIIEEID
jgi:hypothetical protein